MNALTLPGAGRLRLGSVVRHDDGRRGMVLAVASVGASDCDDYPSAGHALVSWLGAWDSPPDEVPLERLGLDLTDATGRAHAAWWLAERMGLVEAMTAQVDRYTGELTLATRHPGGQWAGSPPTKILRARFCPDLPGFVREGSRHPKWVPSLAGLRGVDRTRLPDGSRWVDAEALRLVCLHVGGAS